MTALRHNHSTRAQPESPLPGLKPQRCHSPTCGTFKDQDLSVCLSLICDSKQPRSMNYQSVLGPRERAHQGRPAPSLTLASTSFSDCHGLKPSDCTVTWPTSLPTQESWTQHITQRRRWEFPWEWGWEPRPESSRKLIRLLHRQDCLRASKILRLGHPSNWQWGPSGE